MKSAKIVNKSEYKEEDVLQAVLLADTFDNKFTPLTCDIPKCLIPLANIPLIEYSLQVLQSNGIQEVIVYCCHKAQKVKNYLQDSKWLKSNSSILVKIIISEDAICVGDAMRDLENKSLIRTDFVLLFADTVTNVKFQHYIDLHKKRRLESKDNILSLLFMECPPDHQTRKSGIDDFIITLNGESNRILSFVKVDENDISKSRVQLFLETLSMQLAQIRFDLINCHVAFCSPAVLQLMADNFDYETLFDLVKGLIVNEEVLGLAVHASVISSNEYSVRVSELARYESVTWDVLNRWAYPYVPDICSPNQKYICSRNSIYQSKDVTIHPTVNLVRSVIIGNNTVVKNNTKIQESSLGSNCNIGSNVFLKSAFIFDNVTIGDGIEIKSTMVSSNVSILSGVTVGEGCLIGENVVISNGHIPNNSRIASTKLDEKYIKHGDKCFISANENKMLSEWKKYKRFDNLDLDENVSSESDSDIADHETGVDENFLDSKLFYSEVIANLDRALKENISPDNIILEINSAKHAYGIEIAELTTLVARALLDFALRDGETNASNYFKRYHAQMSSFLPLLKNYVKSGKAQVEILDSTVEFSGNFEVVGNSIVKIVKYLYDEDVLEEDVIIDWYMNNRHNNSPKIMDKLKDFVDWLNNAEEEDD